jgi:hypothetical protein
LLEVGQDANLMVVVLEAVEQVGIEIVVPQVQKSLVGIPH